MTTYVKERKLTVLPRDMEVFTFIETYTRIHGFSPSLKEIADNFKALKQNILRNIAKLEKMGCLVRNKGKHRNIVLIKSPLHI